MPVSLKYWLKNTPEEVLAVPFGDFAARQELIAATLPRADRPSFTVWLTRMEQIHQFVQHVPDLAWELMDFATTPLSLIYSDAKPLARDETPPTEISVRLIIQPELLKVLTTRQPWISVRIKDIIPDFPIESWMTKQIELRVKGKPPQTVKTMRIFNNGQFSFLP